MFQLILPTFQKYLFEGRFRQFSCFFVVVVVVFFKYHIIVLTQQLVFLSREPTQTILEESDQIFVTRSLVRFSISGIIIHSIMLSEIFGYVLNGLPQTHKAALCRGSDHALASSHLVRLNIFEIVRYSNNHALKRKYA